MTAFGRALPTISRTQLLTAPDECLTQVSIEYEECRCCSAGKSVRRSHTVSWDHTETGVHILQLPLQNVSSQIESFTWITSLACGRPHLCCNSIGSIPYICSFDTRVGPSAAYIRHRQKVPIVAVWLKDGGTPLLPHDLCSRPSFQHSRWVGSIVRGLLNLLLKDLLAGVMSPTVPHHCDHRLAYPSMHWPKHKTCH